MDILSLIGTIAGILSFLFYLNDKNTNWKKYIYPAIWLFTGFTLGRVSTEVSKTTSYLFHAPHLLLIFIISILVIVLIMYYVWKTPLQPPQFVGIMMMIGIFMTNVGAMYNNLNKFNLTNQDYLILAEYKENIKNYEESIKFLEIYKEQIEDSKVKEQVTEKINNLRREQLKLNSFK